MIRGLRAGLAVLALGLVAAAGLAEAQRGPALRERANEVHVRELPPEAATTLALIRKGGPFPHAQDDTIFGNRERLLPMQRRGYYREYTVRTPGIRTRGARRIVKGASGELYYTDDHYNSFRRIRE